METKIKQLEREVEDTTLSISRQIEFIENEVKNKVLDTKQRALDKFEDLKESFNVSKQVEKHPSEMVGGAVLTGLIAGAILSSRSRSASTKLGNISEVQR